MSIILNPFGAYKDRHLGESAIFYGSGPTIKEFSADRKDILKIGLNEQIYLDLDLDYWFMGDTFPRNPDKFINCFEDYNEYKPNITKFIRYQLWGERGRMPPGMKHSQYYTCTLGGSPQTCLFKKDISEGSLVGVASISFEALQFILYSGVKNIYLVGHDCDYTTGDHGGSQIGKNLNAGFWIARYWKICEPWIKKKYPKLKIYWVNQKMTDLFNNIDIEDFYKEINK